MFKMYRVKGINEYHRGVDMVILAEDLEDAKNVVAYQTGLSIEDVEKCYSINLK